jgi:plastocyanin
MQNTPRASLSTVVALALLIAGCGSGSGSGSPALATSPPDAGGTVNVVMKSLAFNPAVVRARVGQTVTWTNEDSSPHNVTYVSGPRFRSSRPKMSRGTTFSLTLSQPGTIRYYCSIHPWMQATIVVSP